MGVYTECGGIEVARTEERMEELRRRMASAKSWGIEAARLVTPAEIKELVPYIDETILLGGFYCPTVGVVDSLRAGTIMRERGIEAGGTDGVRRHGGERHGRRARPDPARRTPRAATIEAETVVIACGVWSPLLARMAGAHIPLTPAVHQMIDVGPVPRFEQSTKAIEFPIVRDMDVFMYERQDGVGLEIGSYAHRSILHDPEEIPSIEEAALSPTEFPFTQADFDPQMEDALELMPEIVGDESVGVKYAINGLISLTPDGMPILGETPGGEGPLVGRRGVGQGRPGRRQVGGRVDGARRVAHRPALLRHQPLPRRTRRRAPTSGRGPSRRSRRPTGSCIRPSSGRASATSGSRRCMRSEKALGAVFYEAAGWERPQWYEANAPLVERYGVETREAEWDARWWSPIINAEHLAMREHAGIFDLSAFAIFDVSGPARSTRCSARCWRRWTCRSAGSSTRPC